MTQEAKVRVRLDTGAAKADLQGLTQSAAATAGRVGDGIRNAIGNGMSSLNPFSGAVGQASGAISGSASGGVSDVLGEAFGGWGVSIENFLLGDLGPEARAARQAREETIQAFGQISAHAIPEGAKGYFDQVKSLRKDAETGRMRFEADPRFRGASPEDLLKRVAGVIRELLVEAVQLLASKLIPFSGR